MNTVEHHTIFFHSQKDGFLYLQKIFFKACVHYFSLFLKDRCISLLFRTEYIEKKFNLQLFFLPTVSWTFILSGATTCYPRRPWNFLFRKNNCMCNRDNACDVATCPDEQNTKRSDQTNQEKHYERSSNVCYTIIPGSTYHWISNWIYFKKKIFWSKHFPATTNCRSQHLWGFLEKSVLKIS